MNSDHHALAGAASAVESFERALDLNGLPPTLTVEEAAKILGCGRTLAYQLISRNEFPCSVIRLGRRYVIPTASLLRELGLTAE